MNGLYILSLMFALLSVLPVAILVLRSERTYKKNTRIIYASRFDDMAVLEQYIREIWWETRFGGDEYADDVLVVTDSKAAKTLCKRLKAEFPALITKDKKKFLEYIRNVTDGQKELHRAERHR